MCLNERSCLNYIIFPSQLIVYYCERDRDRDRKGSLIQATPRQQCLQSKLLAPSRASL